MGRPIFPKPGINEVKSQVLSLGLEELRRLARRDKRHKVESLESKREKMKNQVQENNKSTQDTGGTLKAEGVKENNTDIVNSSGLITNGVNRNDVVISDKVSPINLYFIDLVTLEKLPIQAVPRELEYNPVSNWGTIAPRARNNAFYHYKGGEDILTFELDWYHWAIEDRTDVLAKCKWLEARSRNNSLLEPPHPIKLIWDNIMFRDATWTVAQAKYKLTHFHRVHNSLPTQAYQSVVLKKITPGNTSTASIQSLTS